MNFSRTVITAVATAIVSFSTAAADITGAGATFPFPIYAKWAEAYKVQTDIGLNYQSIGSSGGIRQIKAKTVAFGATDAPLTGAELEKEGMVQFPAIIGGTVPVFNVDGLRKGDLRVTGPVLADMFMGKISKWNDLNIVARWQRLPFPRCKIVNDNNCFTFIPDILNDVGAQRPSTTC